MTGAAVNFATAEAGGEALPANNMEAVVTDVMTLCRIEAGFAREGVKGFQYRVVCQRKWSRFLSSLHGKPPSWAHGLDTNKRDRLDQEIEAELADQVLYFTFQFPLDGLDLAHGFLFFLGGGRFPFLPLAVFVNKSLVIIMDPSDISVHPALHAEQKVAPLLLADLLLRMPE